MNVHVLLYDSGKDTEGIHSLELAGKTIVLMFENRDDAERYCGLLEAQDFPRPSIENLDREEIESFCGTAGYEPRFVENGFVPSTEEERLCLVPPQQNRENISWNDEDMNINPNNSEDDINESKPLDDVRRRLEGLL